MTTEKVKLFDLDNNLIDVIELPKRQPDQPPRRIIHRGVAYVEGGGELSFYSFCEFSPVDKNAK